MLIHTYRIHICCKDVNNKLRATMIILDWSLSVVELLTFCWIDNLLVDRWVEYLINGSTVKLDGEFNGCFLVCRVLG